MESATMLLHDEDQEFKNAMNSLAKTVSSSTDSGSGTPAVSDPAVFLDLLHETLDLWMKNQKARLLIEGNKAGYLAL